MEGKKSGETNRKQKHKMDWEEFELYLQREHFLLANKTPLRPKAYFGQKGPA